ncbi:universal stress protein [Actinoplanes sp. NPDC049265]|uniref:universal stress protein n=1 Tax=Actinoplanes sp. NPDC049265 TaxID=3363902 RepID=UPI003719E352
MSGNRIVVGYDASPPSDRALAWALDEAARTGATVDLVYALAFPAYAPAVYIVPGTVAWPDVPTKDAAWALLAAAAAKARAGHPKVAVSEIVEEGPAAAVLRDSSTDAALVVVGGHSHHPVADQVLGSVAVSVAAHAFCSVVIVRDLEAVGRPVVLGLDEWAHAEEAGQFALRQAAARGVPLRAVHAWMPPPDPAIGRRFPNRDEAAIAELVWAKNRLSPWRAEFPGVHVDIASVVGHPYQVLTAATRESQLTVVGARGRGGFRDLRLGSVTRHLLHHGTGPIAIIR